MTETHLDSRYIIEVAPQLYLECYEAACAYCATGSLLFKPSERWPNDPFVKHKDEWLRLVPMFKSPKDARKYIDRNGSKEDFLGWCKDLQKEYGGDGYPKIKKVEVTVTAEVKEERGRKL